jgi:Fe-S cluster assembly ATPase SufC
MLKIDNLHATAGTKEILKGISLTINAGEVHAIMGPNGSGKSTLAQVIAGHPGYEVTKGSITYEGADLLDMDAEVRAQQGVFLAFQSSKRAISTRHCERQPRSATTRCSVRQRAGWCPTASPTAPRRSASNGS